MKKFFGNKAWWMEMSGSFVGGFLGILISFGITAYEAQQHKEKLARKTAVMTIRNIDIGIDLRQEQLDRLTDNREIFNAVLSRYPDKIDEVGPDTLQMFVNALSYRHFAIGDNSAETIFSHSISVWENIEQPQALRNIGACFSICHTFDGICQRLENEGFEAFYEYIGRYDVEDDWAASITEFLKSQRIRYYLQSFDSYVSVLGQILSIMEKTNAETKQMMEITEEELNGPESKKYNIYKSTGGDEASAG